MKGRQRVFKNHAVKLVIRTYPHGFVFGESHLFEGSKPYKTYDECLKALQRYSKKYYGEKAL
jgi:hypothetical protein